jgi:hypothetical protein
MICELDTRGSTHHSTIHEAKSNKMQQYIKILLFPIYIKLNVCRATHRPLLGTKTALAASGFSYVKCCWMCGW